jgi:hypothetical protein
MRLMIANPRAVVVSFPRGDVFTSHNSASTQKMRGGAKLKLSD